MSSKPPHWTTDPEYIQLLNFLIKKTKNVETPLSLTKLTEEFKAESSAPQTFDQVWNRIDRLRGRIHAMEKIDTDTKIEMLFTLKVPIDKHFLKELKKDFEVILDDHRRIFAYSKNRRELKLNTTTKLSVNQERMMKFLEQKSKEVCSPITDKAFLREFKKSSGATEHISYLWSRYKFVKSLIHASADFDQKTKTRMFFVSGASVSYSFLYLLRKDALVKVDRKNRITKYKANDGSLELQGFQSLSGKMKAGKAESEINHSLDSDAESDDESDEYFSEDAESDSENENNLDLTRKNVHPDDPNKMLPGESRAPIQKSRRSEKFDKVEARRAETVTTRSGRVSKKRASDFNFLEGEGGDGEKLSSRKSKKSSTSVSTSINSKSTKEKKKTDTTESNTSKSAKPISDDSMRSDELDDHDYCSSHRAEQNPTKATAGTTDEKENGGSEQNKNMSSTAPTSKKKKRKADTEEVNSSKRAHPDNSMRTNELDDHHRTQSTDDSSRVELKTVRETKLDKEKLNPTDENVQQFKETRKTDTERSVSLKLAKPSSNDSTREEKLDGCYPNQLTLPKIELKPFRGTVLNNEHLNQRDEDIQVLEIPSAPAPENIEAPIKTENPTTSEQVEVSGKVENPEEEEVKPKFTSQLKLLEAMKSLVINLDMPPLSQMKSKICQKIWKLGESNKQILNEEMIMAMDFLVFRITNHSLSNLSETVESVTLIQFLCYLKGMILNLNLDGVNSLLEKIKGRIREPTSKDKSIPVEQVKSLLQTTLDVIGF